MRRPIPTQSRADDGLTRWIADDEPLENTDVVLWYVFGIHHITRVGGLADHAGRHGVVLAQAVRLLRPEPVDRRAAVDEGPADRGGRLHRQRREAQLRERGDEVVRVDALIPEAHGSVPETGPDLHRLDVRDADRWADLLDGIDVVCHQAAMVGAGVTVADLPSYAGHNDLGTAALLAAMHDRGVDALVLASSMVVYGEGRYACPEHGVQQPAARTRAALDAGHFENHCATCARPLGLGAGA